MSFEPKQFGRFYLLEKLAVGGMAEIYKAKTYGAEGFEKLLAIKRILPHCSADKEFITMLIDEAKLSVLLSHANIVQVYDLGKVGEDFFISMEFINGVNLRDIIYRCRELNVEIPAELAVFIISELCKGLDYAHRKTDTNGHPLGIVHRDISPQNALISFEGEVKVVDFGIAKAAMNISHTMAGILKGKIAYMSPEQAMGNPVNYQTDIFSTGIVLYECLTGKKLFTGESQFEVLKKIRTTKIAFENLPAEIPPALRQILAKALAFDNNNRYERAGDMQSELTRYLYSTYIDFTPQKLAAFVRELFESEISRQQNKAKAQVQRERQTSSVSVQHQTAQVDIVHRETGTNVLPPQPEDATQAAAVLEPQPAVVPITTPRRSSARRMVSLLLTLVVIGTGLFIGYQRWLRPLITPQPAAKLTQQYGKVAVTTTPPGATITLDGTKLDQKTPTLIDHLTLQQAYTLTAHLAKHQSVTHSFTPTSTAPLPIDLTLIPTAKITPTPDIPEAPVTTTPTPPIQQAMPASDTDNNTETMGAISAQPTTDPAKTPPTPEPAPPSPKPEPAPPVEKTTAPVQYSSINVRTAPTGAAIYLNGKPTGKHTPATLSEVVVGKSYTVTVRKKGYTGWSRKVTLKSEKPITLSQRIESNTTRTIKTPAKTTPPPPTKEIILPTPTQTPAKAPAAAYIERTTTAGKGTLDIQCKPKGATVYIDGKSYGRAPIMISGLKAGTHQVRLTRKNYNPWNTSVTIRHKKITSIKAKLIKQ